MIASYDSHSGIVYIQVDERIKIHKTVEFDAQTILELGEDGGLVGIEMIKPSKAILNRIAKKYQRAELGRVDLDSLRKAVR